MVAEVKIINGTPYRREGDRGVPISMAEYKDLQVSGAMAGVKDDLAGNARANTVEQALVGFSKGGSDIMDAGIDLYGRLTGDESLVQGLEGLRADEQAVYNRTEPSGVMRGGEMTAKALPYVGAGAAVAPFAGTGMLTQMAGQGLAAMGTGAATTYGPLRDRMMTGLEEGGWAAGGAGAGAAIERIFSRLNGARMSATQAQRQAGKVMDTGMQLSPGKATGNRMLQRVFEPWVESMGGMAKARQMNDDLYEATVGKALGQADDAIDLSATGLGQAADDIGKQFDVLKGVDIQLDPQQAETLVELGNISPYVDFPTVTDKLTGNQYKQVRRQLSELAKGARNNPSAPVGQAEKLEEFRAVLDDSFAAAAPEGAAKVFKQAREKWKILETIERGAALSPDGVINPNSMRGAVNQMWGKAARRAKTAGIEPETAAWIDMTNAQASKASKSAVGSSGTAERSGASLMGQMGAHAAGAGTGAAAYGHLSEDPTLEGYIMSGLGGAATLNQILRNYGRMGNLMGAPGRTGQMLGPLMAAPDEE